MNRAQRRALKLSPQEIVRKNKNDAKLREQAARDKIVRMNVEMQTQKNFWLMLIALHESFGFSTARLAKVSTAYVEVMREFQKMQVEDVDYAREKLRMAAEEVTHMSLKSVGADDLEAEIRALEERGCKIR